MEIKKLIDGYEIKVSHDEFDTLVSALDDAISFDTLVLELDDAISWEDGFGFNTQDYCDLQKELRAVKKRFLTDDETQGIRNCFVCRHCLPPFRRENGNMCSLNECKFEEAKPMYNVNKENDYGITKNIIRFKKV